MINMWSLFSITKRKVSLEELNSPLFITLEIFLSKLGEETNRVNSFWFMFFSV
jgi:hypothetical protein